MKIEYITQAIFAGSMFILLASLLISGLMLKFLIKYMKKPAVWLMLFFSFGFLLLALGIHLYRIFGLSTQLMTAGPLDLFPMIKNYLTYTLFTNLFIFFSGFLFFAGVYIFVKWIEG